MAKWKTEPYPGRVYSAIKEYVVTESIPPHEATQVQQQLKSSLKNGYRGPALDCDDMDQMEAC